MSIVSTLSPLVVRLFLSPSRITLCSLGQLFISWIIRSLSKILPFSLNLFIQICSPAKFEIHLSGYFSIDSNLLLWISLLSFNNDEAVCRAYLLTSLSHAILQFPSRKSALSIPYQTKCHFPNRGSGIDQKD